MISISSEEEDEINSSMSSVQTIKPGSKRSHHTSVLSHNTRLLPKRKKARRLKIDKIPHDETSDYNPLDQTAVHPDAYESATK